MAHSSTLFPCPSPICFEPHLEELELGGKAAALMQERP